MDTEDVQRIGNDLYRVVDQARWAHTHGYIKAGHGLDAEHGVDLSKPEVERMRGPRYDLQIGDHRARVAYQHACRTIARADLLLARALRREPQPQIVALHQYVHPDLLDKAAKAVRWRLHAVDPKANAKTLGTIGKALDGCERKLSKALDAGSTDGIAHGEMCKTCRIRPRAEREKDDGTMRASKAGECDTCATYRNRAGHERPTSLDTGPIREAKAAQARRIARGEHWGAA